MAIKQNDYKIGMWLKCKRTGELAVILEEKWRKRYTIQMQTFVLKSCTQPNYTMELYPTEIDVNFDFNPTAQVLFGD